MNYLIFGKTRAVLTINFICIKVNIKYYKWILNIKPNNK